MGEEGGRTVAVFCLTRRGTLLVQAGGRAGLAEGILEACESEPIEITGVIGEWSTAGALWRLLCDDPRFVPHANTTDRLYGRPLTDSDVANEHESSPQEAAAQRLYESMGFRFVDRFALLFGGAPGARCRRVSDAWRRTRVSTARTSAFDMMPALRQ